MNYEFNELNASFEHWQAFSVWASGRFAILDRDELPLPDWFVPPAHGVVIPSRYYMSNYVGFDASIYQSRGWRPIKRVCGYEKRGTNYRYLTRPCGDLFSVERSQGRCLNYGAVLAYYFSSTPVFTRTLKEAQYLAQLKELPLSSGLRWVTLRPYSYRWEDLESDWAYVSSTKLTR